MRRVLGVTWLQHLTPTPLVVAYWMSTDLSDSEDKEELVSSRSKG